MVKKEIGQPDHTIMRENLLAMSRDGNIKITVVTKAGQSYDGILKTIFDIWPVGTGGCSALYLRQEFPNAQEFHSCIPMENIDSISSPLGPPIRVE